jgi:hypothetical protein
MFDQPADPSQPGSAEPRDPSEIPTERLEREIAELAAHINAGMCRWLELVAEFDRREGWGSWGCRSCAEWVAWQCAVTPRAAREHVRVGRRLAELPGIRALFAEGRLSYSKVRALTRVADRDSEGELIELARQATAAQLERIVRGLRRLTTADAQEQHGERYLNYWWEADGSLTIRGQLASEDGALFVRAMEASHDRLFGRGSAEPRALPRPRRHTNADALVGLADFALASSASAPRGKASRTAAPRRTGGDRYQVVLHVDADSSVLADGSAVAPETARRLACDASIVREGRKSRSIPPFIRRILKARDASCRFPGCENRRFLDAHHIHHWATGGETRLDNLIHLCPRHHRLVHEGGHSVERLTDGSFRFRNSRGSVLTDAPSVALTDPGRLIGAGRLGGRASGVRPLSGTNERLDTGWALAVVAGRVGPAP